MNACHLGFLEPILGRLPIGVSLNRLETPNQSISEVEFQRPVPLDEEWIYVEQLANNSRRQSRGAVSPYVIVNSLARLPSSPFSFSTTRSYGSPDILFEPAMT